MGPATHQSSSYGHPNTPTNIHLGGRAEEKCARREEEEEEERKEEEGIEKVTRRLWGFHLCATELFVGGANGEYSGVGSLDLN